MDGVLDRMVLSHFRDRETESLPKRGSYLAGSNGRKGSGVSNSWAVSVGKNWVYKPGRSGSPEVSWLAPPHTWAP